VGGVSDSASGQAFGLNVAGSRVSTADRTCLFAASKLEPALGGIGLRPVKDDDIADACDQVAGRPFGDDRRQFLFLFFEVGELDLDEFVTGEFLVDAPQECVGQTLFADTQDRFQALCVRLEFTDLPVA
jgi:hypothetical protein